MLTLISEESLIYLREKSVLLSNILQNTMRINPKLFVATVQLNFKCNFSVDFSSISGNVVSKIKMRSWKTL